MHPLPSRTFSITIRRCPHQVYDFLAEPRNWPAWASGLGGNFRVNAEPAGGWLADGPTGLINLHFSPMNDFGVLDHVVTLASGESVLVPMRVIINGGGSDVLLTLFRQPGMDDASFAADGDWVMRDLQALKVLMEAGRS